MKSLGKRQYDWLAVGRDGEVVDVFLQTRGDGVAAKRFFKRLLRNNRVEPGKIVTDDKLRSYGVAHEELVTDAIHDTPKYSNYRVELSHQLTRVRERGMHRPKSTRQAQRFLGVRAAVHNVFDLDWNSIFATNYR